MIYHEYFKRMDFTKSAKKRQLIVSLKIKRIFFFLHQGYYSSLKLKSYKTFSLLEIKINSLYFATSQANTSHFSLTWCTKITKTGIKIHKHYTHIHIYIILSDNLLLVTDSYYFFFI